MRLMVIAAGAVCCLSATICNAVVVVVPEQRSPLHQDELCVPEAAKVGDTIKNVDGDALTLLNIHGWFISGMSPCERGAPRVARARFTEAETFHSTLAFVVPVGFTAANLSVRDRFECVRLRALHSSRLLTVLVRSWDRTKVPDMEASSERQRRAVALIARVTVGAVEHTIIDGSPALQWQSHQRGRLAAPDFGVMTILVQGDHETVQIVASGPDKQLQASLDDIAPLVKSISGLKSAGSARPDAVSATMATAPVTAAPATQPLAPNL